MRFGLDFVDEAHGAGFLAHMFAEGVLVVASSQRLDVIQLYPPLILETAQVAEFSERAQTALHRLA